MEPAFFVLHHPGSPLTKSSPPSLAWGSFEASLHPGSVHAEIVVMNLVTLSTKQAHIISETTHEMRRLTAVPVPANMKATLVSFKALAKRAPLSYFS